MDVLDLAVSDYQDPARWRFVLTEPGGAFVADHEVSLDTSAADYEGFCDLHRFLRWNADPAARLESEAVLVERVGRWVAGNVLGPIGPALVDSAPVVVRLQLPPQAVELATRPFELAWVDDAPLARQDVSTVVCVGGARLRAKDPVAGRLRVLGVFSLPTDASALALRHERYELARLFERIARVNHRGIELRVVQYGVTRERLGELLREGDGWDVVHFSGHGLRAGLVLEKADGSADVVSTEDLVRLLRPARARLKLVVLSSCYSAAATAAATLQVLGVDAPAEPGEEEGAPMPALAQQLVERLGCSALAMRYPVVDDFAVALATELYELAVGAGQPLARALQLALPDAASWPPTLGAPAASVATPALVGPAAAELRLDAPAGAPLVFDQAALKLAGFPPQPPRFVGRVGALAKASAALAPQSGRSGVLFHGMAGAGKTAAALELAYGHEASFEVAVWYRAPDDGEDIASAVAGFALALEARLEGLSLVHRLEDADALGTYLPFLAEFFERHRVLVVLDNLESLLTSERRWRDARWERVLGALWGHDGLGRVVLTSRRVPEALDDRVVVEPLHALSLTEAVLLARQLPHLGALIDGHAGPIERGRALVARALAVVQGHPKLLELADGQAPDAAALEAHLDAADEAWGEAAGRLGAFFATGESQASPGEYLRVLEGWTRQAAAALPEAPTTAFWLLCCLEEGDRLGYILQGNWADLWARLGRPGEAPSLEDTLAPLVARALVEVEGPEAPLVERRYQIHPAVAEAGRAEAGPQFQAAVDAELAAFWQGVFSIALEREGQDAAGRIVAHAGLAAAPYLLRQADWATAGPVLEQVLFRDASPATVAAVVPLVRRVAAATVGTERELVDQLALARALCDLDPAEAQRLLRDLLPRAVAAECFDVASAAAANLANLLQRQGRLAEALALVEEKRGHTARAGLGPWTQLSNEVDRLALLAAMGRNEEVLEEVTELRPRTDELPEEAGPDERVRPWNVRETVLEVAHSAALALGRWELALELSAEVLASKRQRGTGEWELARTRYSDYGPLLSLGRVGEARQLLLVCREVFERAGDVQRLAQVFGALAGAEDALGHREDAAALQERALRYSYVSGDVDDMGTGHFNLAHYLSRRGDDPGMIVAHRLAAAVINYQTRSGRFNSTVDALALDVARVGEDVVIPASLEELRARVEQVEGVRFGALVERLPARAATPDLALAEVLALAHRSAEERRRTVLEQWNSMIDEMVAAAGGDAEARSRLEALLDELAESDDWADLARALRRLVTGERDREALLAGLDAIDAIILSEALRRVASR